MLFIDTEIIHQIHFWLFVFLNSFKHIFLQFSKVGLVATITLQIKPISLLNWLGFFNGKNRINLLYFFKGSVFLMNYYLIKLWIAIGMKIVIKKWRYDNSVLIKFQKPLFKIIIINSELKILRFFWCLLLICI